MRLSVWAARQSSGKWGGGGLPGEIEFGLDSSWRRGTHLTSGPMVLVRGERGHCVAALRRLACCATGKEAGPSELGQQAERGERGEEAGSLGPKAMERGEFSFSFTFLNFQSNFQI